jgi:hypothetical protein
MSPPLPNIQSRPDSPGHDVTTGAVMAPVVMARFTWLPHPR